MPCEGDGLRVITVDEPRERIEDIATETSSLPDRRLEVGEDRTIWEGAVAYLLVPVLVSAVFFLGVWFRDLRGDFSERTHYFESLE